jgi:hypothetical protein
MDDQPTPTAVSRKGAALAKKILLASLALIIALGAAEIIFRWAGIELPGPENHGGGLPPFWEKPTVPLGSAFFKRPGPLQWTGRPLNAFMRRYFGLTNAYPQEKTFTVTYDAQGFRNEGPLTDWDIAVVGDSFVELGYLPYESLFTSRLGQLLRRPTKNLGVSGTGPLGYLRILEAFGLSAQLRDVIVVFFEGNDVRDLEEEGRSLTILEKKGTRAYHPKTEDGTRPRGSFFRAVGNWLRAARARASNARRLKNAVFVSGTTQTAVTVFDKPIRARDITAEQALWIQEFFKSYAALARRSGFRPWLAYMPTKLAVLAGFLEFPKKQDPAFVQWTSTDLPEFLRAQADRFGVLFVDLTPALRRASAAGSITYNPLGDAHLNAEGCAVVAGELAAALSRSDGGKDR